MNKKIQTLKYILLDLLSAMIAWTLFFIYRKYAIDPTVLERISEITADQFVSGHYHCTIVLVAVVLPGRNIPKSLPKIKT